MSDWERNKNTNGAVLWYFLENNPKYIYFVDIKTIDTDKQWLYRPLSLNVIGQEWIFCSYLNKKFGKGSPITKKILKYGP